MLLQQLDHGERHEGRHHRGALLPDVTAVLDGLHDRRVRRRSSDAQLFERLDQARLGVAGGRLRAVALSLQRGGAERVVLGETRQAALGVVRLGVGLVGTLDVGAEEAGLGDRLAAGGEVGDLARGGRARQAHRHALTDRVGHLGRDRALPDQLVEAELVGADLAPDLARRAEVVAGRADRLVRLLRVLHLPGVPAGFGRDELVAVQLADLRSGGGERRLRQVRRVGTHIGDVAVLVQPLGYAHRLLAGEAQLAGRLLLQRRGHERRVRLAAVRLLLDLDDLERGTVQAGGEPTSAGLVKVDHVTARASGGRVEVLAGGHAITVDGDQRGGEDAWIALGGTLDRERALDVPVLAGAELHPGALALHDDPGGHRLHTARRQLRHDLLPQDRADLVPVEPVEDAAGLLGVDQGLVQLARVRHGLLDRGAGDLVEHHPADRDLRLQRLDQVPGDGLALAVLICREVQLGGLLDQFLELGDLGLAVRRDHVQRLEAVVDVDAEARPRLTLVLRGDVGGVARQVADVADARLDDVAGPEVTGDRLGLRRGLDDDKPHPVGAGSAVRALGTPGRSSGVGGRSHGTPSRSQFRGRAPRREMLSRRRSVSKVTRGAHGFVPTRGRRHVIAGQDGGQSRSVAPAGGSPTSSRSRLRRRWPVTR